eukprot:TRINITY_DN62477_c0_g1_i1.p1 TRINITY_DN62477_c0_g1~~TRINITY_DN62477_c0_g1_i1.p1  ORF type:complete len:544 (-),score=113.68 TRINITY_DN62477_c0_g1_i1:162-1760(-)
MALVCADPPGVFRYEGVVGTYYASEKFGYIRCDQLLPTYGQEIFFQSQDCFGAPIARDQRVSFLLEESAGYALEATPTLAAAAAGKAVAKSVQVFPSAADPPDAVRYTGIVTSFSLQSAWGFITCQDLQKVFQKDVFFHVKDCGGALVSKGQTVTFLLAKDSPPGKPQARSVQVPGNSVVVGVVPVPGQRYSGTVTSYAVASAWGFILCPEIKAYFGKDVFFHNKDCNGQVISKGATVSFELDVPSDGKPQARSVVVEAGGVAMSGATGYASPVAGGCGGFASFAGALTDIGMTVPSGQHALSPSLHEIAARQLQGQLQGQIQAAVDMGLQDQLHDQLLALGDVGGVDQATADWYAAAAAAAAANGYAVEASSPSHSSAGAVAVGTQLQGSVQSFSQQAGWGFVECAALNLPPGKGVFFHVKDAANFGATIPTRGVPVSFSVGQGPSGRMQAKHVTPIGLAAPTAAQLSGGTKRGFEQSHGAYQDELTSVAQQQSELLTALAAQNLQAYGTAVPGEALSAWDAQQQKRARSA